MARCAASYLTRRDAEQPWPGGDWQQCPSPGERIRVVPITSESITVVHLCEAHAELWDAEGQLARVVVGPMLP